MVKSLNLFFLSLLQVSAKRLVVSLIIALCMTVSLDLLVRYGLIGKLPESYIIRNKNDNYAHATYEAIQARQLASGVTPVYIFGGSGMREAVMTGGEIGETFNNVFNKNAYQGYVLATKYRTLAQDLSLLDLISERPGVIVYGISFTRLSFGENRYKDQLKGKAIVGRNKSFIEYMNDHYPEQIGVNSLVAFLSSQTYLLPATRLFADKAMKFFEPVKFKQHKHNRLKKSKEGRRDSQLASWKKRRLIGHVPKHFDMNMNLLEHFIQEAQRQGHKVLIVEQPMDHEYLAGRLDETFDYYRPRLKNMVLGVGASYADFEGDLGLGTEWFVDLQHLWSSEARQIFTRRIADEVMQIQAHQ